MGVGGWSSTITTETNRTTKSGLSAVCRCLHSAFFRFVFCLTGCVASSAQTKCDVMQIRTYLVHKRNIGMRSALLRIAGRSMLAASVRAQRVQAIRVGHGCRHCIRSERDGAASCDSLDCRLQAGRSNASAGGRYERSIRTQPAQAARSRGGSRGYSPRVRGPGPYGSGRRRRWPEAEVRVG